MEDNECVEWTMKKKQFVMAEEETCQEMTILWKSHGCLPSFGCILQNAKMDYPELILVIVCRKEETGRSNLQFMHLSQSF